MNSIQCPYCGTANDVGRALCINCQSPLTAYSGQLKGDAHQGKLAAQVELLKARPPAVIVMAIYLCMVAAGWPVRAIINVFAHRERTNAEGTNYLASAFGSIAPLFITALCLPLALLLVWFAWAVWNQREWAWKFSLGTAIIFTGYILFKYPEYHVWAILWAVVSIVVIAFWFQSRTKAWFGIF